MNMAAMHGDFNGIEIMERDGALMALSREVAKNFGKQHKDVLRAIRNLECSDDFNERNFAPVEYLDAKGEKRTEYGMTRDGFSFLVMGFTGRQAAQWKEQYIAAFNEMEKRLLAHRQASTIDLNDPDQLVPLLTSYAQRTKIAEARVTEMAPKAEAFDRLDTADGNMTIRPASKVLGYPERKLAKWMEVNGWAFRQSGRGPLQAYVGKRNAGYLDHKLRRFDDPNTGDTKIDATLVITPKGIARLAKLLPKEGGAA